MLESGAEAAIDDTERQPYANVAAVQRAWRQNLSVEPGIFKALMFAPLATALFDPDVVFVLCNARQGMQQTRRRPPRRSRHYGKWIGASCGNVK